jgi:hypothetical protein
MQLADFFFLLQKSKNILKKDCSALRPKSTILEKAVQDLEKTVAECKCFEVSHLNRQCEKHVTNASFPFFKYYYSKATNYGKTGG